MTIKEFINWMKKSMGFEWKETAIDVFLYGDPNTRLNNVAVTMMATQDVLEKAVEKDCNLIITHEPLFYNHHNQIGNLEHDIVYKAKVEYLRNNQLCIFHLHDNLHHAKMDYIAVGMMEKLNWGKYRTDDTYKRFRMADVKLKQILGDLEEYLDAATIKYIGNKEYSYENVFVSWGFMMMDNAIDLINQYESSVLITGETHEWEFAEYVYDANQMGLNKSLIMTGHVASEESGVEYFCGYLQKKIPSLSISYLKTGDLFKI